MSTPAHMPEKTRILIAEDHAILREGLIALLQQNPGLEIVGEARDGQEAVRLAIKLLPHILIIDLSMPNTNGTEAIPQIKRRHPEIKILVLTVHNTEEYVRATLNAGADGYVLKEDSHRDLVAAIAQIARGNTYLSPGICSHVVSGFLGGPGRAQGGEPGRSSWDSLSLREREILKLIAEGGRNKDIASYLCISVKTVEKHRANLMQKLHLRSVSELTAFAIRNNLLAA